MALNILVIDDDVEIAQRLMNNLKRADVAHVIGDIQVDDSIIRLESIEKYDVACFGKKFDLALIDYQLNSSFTGILVSAWISLHLNIPRITLTTAPYPGEPDYFNDFILKNEITDSPSVVISRIVNCVENYNSKEWLERQHRALVQKYQELLVDANRGQDLSNQLVTIASLLDHFEKIIDTQQEADAKLKIQYTRESIEFRNKADASSNKIRELNMQLDMYLRELKKYD